MKILYVEDDVSTAKSLVDTINTSGKKIEFTISSTLTDAQQQLNDNLFDYLILDLAIPLDTGDEADILHGAALLSEIQDRFPGLAVMILTGQSTDQLVSELLEGVKEINLWGQQLRKDVIQYSKLYMDKVYKMLLADYDLYQSMSSIPITSFQNQPLTAEILTQEKIIVKSYCKFREGDLCRLEPIREGASESSVYRIKTVDQSNQILDATLAKIGSHDDIELELNNYRDYVTRLGFGNFIPRIEVNIAGGYDKTAVFYNLAEGYERNFFDIADEEIAQTAVQEVKDALSRWHLASNTQMVTIGFIRRLLCSDESFQKIMAKRGDLNVDEIENKEVRVNMSIQHGDLHGANILVTSEGKSAIIDNGDIKQAPVSLDPITLALSPWFHQQGLAVFKEKEKAAYTLASWFERETCEAELGNPEWLSLVRNWIQEVTFSHLEVAAVVFAYAIRQLKYDDVDGAFAEALIHAAIHVINDSE